MLFSPTYYEMRKWFTDQVREPIKALGRPPLTGWKTDGIDGLPQPYRDLSLEQFHRCLDIHAYELSYNQTCNGFNDIFREQGWVDDEQD